MKTIIQTPTPNYKESCDFYETIGFDLIKKDQITYVYSNGVTIELNEDRYSRAGLKYFGKNWEAFLLDTGLMLSSTRTPNGFLVVSPSGCCVYLEDERDNIPTGKNIPLIGTYGGFSLETNQIEESIKFWSLFGYKQTMGNLEHGWVALSNDYGFSISLMKYQCCPHLFFNPSLSYFNGTDNLSIIERVKAAKVSITEEITHFNPEGIVDNIIIRDPGGLGFFIFSD
jgi:predicted enzyme related to lactoylglutathione lyase